MPSSSSPDGRGCLQIRNAGVAYGRHVVLAGADLDLRPGEMHGVIGPNGSGKSSLFKLMAGLVPMIKGGTIIGPDGSRRSSIGAPERRTWGLSFVHQDLALVPELSVVDNLFLGGPPLPTTAVGTIAWRRAHRIVGDVLDELGLAVDPRASVGDLVTRDQIQLAVARALMRMPAHGGFLFLDEVTALLDESDAGVLLARVRALASDRNTGIAFVTHRIREVREYADRVTALRDGSVVLRGTADLDPARLRASMGGTTDDDGTLARPQASEATAGRAASGHPPVLRLRGVQSGSLRSFDLELRPSEIVGVTGLAGEGKEDLVRLLCGESGRFAGSAELFGTERRTFRRIRTAREGLGVVPADRVREGAIQDLTLWENLLLPNFGHHARTGIFSVRSARRSSARTLRSLRVDPPEPARGMGTLSGGNQQKVVVGRWLAYRHPVLLLHEPTAGVDVRSRDVLYEEIRTAADGGQAVLVVTSDTDEAVALCDRVLVLTGGRIHAELSGGELTSENVVQHSFGGRDVAS